MKTLWIYRDSFSEDLNIDWQWHRQLAQRWNYQPKNLRGASRNKSLPRP